MAPILTFRIVGAVLTGGEPTKPETARSQLVGKCVRNEFDATSVPLEIMSQHQNPRCGHFMLCLGEIWPSTAADGDAAGCRLRQIGRAITEAPHQDGRQRRRDNPR